MKLISKSWALLFAKSLIGAYNIGSRIDISHRDGSLHDNNTYTVERKLSVDITREHGSRHSEQDFTNRFGMLVDSGAGLVQVRAHEVMRATLAMRKAAVTDGGIYKEWDVVNGFRTFDKDTLSQLVMKGDDTIVINEAFQAPLEQLRNGDKSSSQMFYYVYVNPHYYLENNPNLVQLILMYQQTLPASNVCVVLVTPDVPLPDYLGEQILSIPFATPGLGELRESLDSIIAGVSDSFSEGIKVSDSDKTRICFAGAGMSEQQFSSFASLAIVEQGRLGSDTLTTEALIAGVSLGKTEIVNSSEILELYPTADMDLVGGMDNLKNWVAKRAKCYGDEAKDFGVEPPKGMVFVGPPGTGKSLAAKAVAGVLGVPLVRLDFGRVFNSLVGASEERIRRALAQVESMAPVVLFCDEIDKGLGGIAGGSGGDSGVSMRVLGSFLTWLQDCKHPVFTMVTANNIDGLPPELLRRGRFDAIFATSLPTDAERKEVLRIHLELRGRKLKDFPTREVNKVIDASNRYVPAEIESAVKDGLIDAFDEGVKMTMEHVRMALISMTPLSKAFEQQIAKMSTWAADNATPASLGPNQVAATKAAAANRIRTRVRGK